MSLGKCIDIEFAKPIFNPHKRQDRQDEKCIRLRHAERPFQVFAEGGMYKIVGTERTIRTSTANVVSAVFEEEAPAQQQGKGK